MDKTILALERLIRIFLCGLFFVILTIGVSRVYAIGYLPSDIDDIFAENNIIFYDPCGGGGGGGYSTGLSGNGDYSKILGAKNANMQYTDFAIPKWSDKDTAAMARVLTDYGDLAYQVGEVMGVPWIAVIVQIRYEDPGSVCGRNNFWGNGCPPGTPAGGAKIQGANLGEGFAQYAETLSKPIHSRALGIADPKQFLETLGPTWVQGNPNGAGYALINSMKKSIDALQAFVDSPEGQAIVQTFGNYHGGAAGTSSSSSSVCNNGDSNISATGVGEAAGIPKDQRMAWLFPNGVPNSPSEMAAYLTTIEVPIIDPSGNQSTTTLTVHVKLANEFIAIFNDMLKVSKFRVKPTPTTYAYSWRNMASGTGSRSHHSYGVAIDINPSDNPASYTAGNYAPGTNIFSVTPEVVGIWKAHGFYWGGDWSGKFTDYMHFSYTNH